MSILLNKVDMYVTKLFLVLYERNCKTACRITYFVDFYFHALLLRYFFKLKTMQPT
jgi:hypothetical protein